MKARSFYPDQKSTTLYAMAGDDLSLYFDLDNLTPKQLADHISNIELTGLLQVANQYMGKPIDHVAMYEEFSREPWAEVLDFYRLCFQQMGITQVDKKNLQFHPHERFYESLSKTKPNIDLITLYLLSGSNKVLHKNEKALDISRAINSKMVFAKNAVKSGIPTPETIIFPKKEIDSKPVAEFLKHHKEVMLKIMGLGGARNVISITSLEEAKNYLEEYDGNMEVLFQRKVSTDTFTEMTVDLMISEKEIRIANVRKILFAEGLWVGNLIGSSVEITDEHKEILLKVGQYAQEMGHVSQEGLNCGIDFFISADEILVTEINARWTGGLFPAEMQKRLNLGKKDVIAFFDTVSVESLPLYKKFLSKHLFPNFDAGFSNVPIGFSPFPITINSREQIFIWHMIVGDLDAFKAAKSKALPDFDMPTADVLSINL